MSIDGNSFDLSHTSIFSFADLSPSLLSNIVTDETNQNVTTSLKELLIRHWCLGNANFDLIQFFMKPRIFLDNNKGEWKHGAIIVPKSPFTSRCSRLHFQCASCESGKARCRTIHKTEKWKLVQALRSRNLSAG